MARKVAIAIGVGQSGNLVTLEGARNGAREFEAWASSEGYETVELIDGPGDPITAQMVVEAVRGAVRAGDVERLLIYFAGHGVAKGTALDFWLLSAGPDDPNEPVNVDASLREARQSGIPHVAVFADACRTMAGKDRMGLGGTVIFPSAGVAGDVELDRFFAARCGFASQEVVPDDEAQRAFGIFTKCLMDALQGQDSAAGEAINANGDLEVAVTAQSLRAYLRMAVPEETSRRPNTRPQQPDCIPTSSPPRNIYRVLPNPPAGHIKIDVLGQEEAHLRVLTSPNGRTYQLHIEGDSPLEFDVPIGYFYDIECEIGGTRCDLDIATQVRQVTGDKTLFGSVIPGRRAVTDPDDVRFDVRVLDERGQPHYAARNSGFHRVITRDAASGATRETVEMLGVGARPEVSIPPSEPAVDRLIERLDASPPRDHFETLTGLTIRGARPTEVVGPPDEAHGLFEEGDAWHVRGEPGRSGSVLIALEDGRWIAGAFLAGFIGSIVVGTEGVDGLTYLPAGGSRYDELDPHERELAGKALSVATAAIHSGRFEVVAEEASTVARRLRRYKHVNPTLGIFAAYAYDAVGRTDQVRDIVRWLDDLDQPVPYDVALLAGDLDHLRIAPSYPLLTQGWAYLRPDAIHPAIAAARQTLAPSLWATPTGDGGEKLAEAIHQGDVL